MVFCPDCGKEVNRLVYHHDPPKSFLRKGLVSPDVKKNNRRTCNNCHRKADAKWGIKRNKGRHNFRRKKSPVGQRWKVAQIK